jgi:transposase
MKPYSLDLRQRVVEAYENGEGTHEELAEAFCVSLSWIEKLLRRW